MKYHILNRLVYNSIRVIFIIFFNVIFLHSGKNVIFKDQMSQFNEDIAYITEILGIEVEVDRETNIIGTKIAIDVTVEIKVMLIIF